MYNTKIPLISIITVSYNVASTIEQTILSIINQNFDDYEYIIVDGGSTDGTVDIIKKHQDKITFWISEPDKGIYDAMNKGLKFAKGVWVNFMNAGDSFYDLNVLRNLELADLSDCQVVYGSINCITKSNSFILKPKPLEEMKDKMIFCHQAGLVKIECLKEYKFDTTFEIAADYNLFRTLFISGCQFKEKDIIVANYEAEEGVSSTRFYKMYKEYAIIVNEWDCFNVKIVVLLKVFKNVLINKMRKIIPVQWRLIIKKHLF